MTEPDNAVADKATFAALVQRVIEIVDAAKPRAPLAQPAPQFKDLPEPMQDRIRASTAAVVAATLKVLDEARS